MDRDYESEIELLKPLINQLVPRPNQITEFIDIYEISRLRLDAWTFGDTQRNIAYKISEHIELHVQNTRPNP